ncbi:hypothetical protein D9611_007708 [Ephemerocybe angulata]|uniref:GST N-terminal domain-containing protein n=1 Tax=Ephemerocybe angulata TaxID=980116 RepID=A0A8H5FCS2_9AGAR|nr:hypothetical protein D9611_007708 [Tulosesus angulatus]
MSIPPVFIYRYDNSPYAQKIDNALALKGVPHKRVQVSPMLPRPEVSQELGINYRRIPLLSIGNDVYCDTGLIALALERRFPASQGYTSLLPPNKNGRTDTGLIKAFLKFYEGAGLFNAAVPLLPWEKLPAPFLKDRGDLMGAPSINAKGIIASRDGALSQLSSHLALLEEQLSDGREWLLDTAQPGLPDISVHFILAWAKGFESAKSLWDEKRFPHVLAWLKRTSTVIAEKKKQQGPPPKISGAEAGKIIASSDYESYSVVGFDTEEAQRLRLQLGDTVRIAPTDTGKNHPTTGKLVALNLEEVVLEIQGKNGVLRCHFPRLGYSIAPVKKDSKL